MKSKKLKTEVFTIRCPNCKDRIYSRTRHDFNTCSCGDISIDGGFDYIKVSGKNIVDLDSKKVYINATKDDLYKDWNTRKNKFGKIKD